MEENKNNLPKPQSMKKIREGLKKNLFLQVFLYVIWLVFYLKVIGPTVLEWFVHYRLISGYEMYQMLKLCIPMIGVMIPLVLLLVSKMKSKKNAMISFFLYMVFVAIYLVALEPTVYRHVFRFVMNNNIGGAWVWFYGTKVMGFIFPFIFFVAYAKIKKYMKKVENTGENLPVPQSVEKYRTKYKTKLILYNVLYLVLGGGVLFFVLDEVFLLPTGTQVLVTVLSIATFLGLWRVGYLMISKKNKGEKNGK